MKYKYPYYNIGKASITDVSASMDGKEYETITNWDVEDSFQDKAYKTGIYRPQRDEYDICAGISQYGKHTYKLKYTIKGMIASLNDADMLYWNLFPQNFNTSPNKVNITIYGDFIRDDIVSTYGYGKGDATFYAKDNKIYVNSNSSVKNNEYITLLIRFNKDTFATKNTIKYDFNYYLNMSNNREKYNQEEKNTYVYNNIFKILKTILSTVAIIAIPLICSNVFLNTKVKNKQNYIGGYLKCTFGEEGNEVPKKVDYYRDIPNNGDIYRSFWIASNYGLMEKREDFMGAILLKWLLDENIKFNDDNIELLNSPGNKELELENKLYSFFRGASTHNILEKENFKDWCLRNPSKMYHWFTDVIDAETSKLAKEGKAKMIKSDDEFHAIHYEIDDKMMNEAKNIAGFKKFLEDFSLMNQKEKIEVKLWKQYLIYAQMFGMADKISKEFKELYPELVEIIDESNFKIADLKRVSTSSDYIIKTTDLAITRSYDALASSSRSSGYLSGSSDSPSSFSSGGGGGSFGSSGGSSFGGRNSGGGGGFR